MAAFTFHDINDLLVAMRKIPFFTMARRDNLGPRSGDSNGRGGSLQAYNREAVVNTLQASLSVAFFSLGGFPATAGFVGKIFTILILIEANYYVTAAAVSFLSAVTATIYGLAAFACVSGPSNDKRSAFPTVRSLTKTNLLLIGVLAILLILGGVLGFQPLAPRWILEFWAVFS